MQYRLGEKGAVAHLLVDVDVKVWGCGREALRSKLERAQPRIVMQQLQNSAGARQVLSTTLPACPHMHSMVANTYYNYL
jgi:hypothetical protein